MRKLILNFTIIATTFVVNSQVKLVKEINDQGAKSSNPANLFVYNNKIYFAADDSSGTNSPGNNDLGKELWVSDGTESGTFFLKDIRGGNKNSNPNFFFEHKSKLYFSANTAAGNVLYTTNGTERGTMLTGDNFIFKPTILKNLVYYVKTTDGNKLYEFNGSGTANVANLGTGMESVVGANIVAYKNKIYGYMSYSDDKSLVGTELYEYNPSTDVFTLVKDVNPGAEKSNISDFTVVEDVLFFSSDKKLWKTDGTPEGTVAVSIASLVSDVKSFYSWKSKLYFEGDDGTGDQLWVYDLKTNTVARLSTISGSNTNHDPSNYVANGDYLYYKGKSADNSNTYLYRTNGVKVEQLNNTIKDVDDLVVLKDILYFEGDNGITGNELYSFDPATLFSKRITLKSIKLYPNPVVNHIIVPNTLLNTVFTITNTSGQLVQSGFVDSERIDINLLNGCYFLSFKTKKGLVTKKILVK